MTDQEKQEFAALKTTVSRLQESNANMRASVLLSEALSNTTLKPRGRDRVRTMALANVPMADGVLDEVKFQESVKKTIEDELAYLQESGVGPRPVVRAQGAVKETADDGKELQESEVAANADKVFNESMSILMGKEKK